MINTAQRRLLLAVTAAGILGGVVVVVLLAVAHAQDAATVAQVAPATTEVTGAPNTADAGATPPRPPAGTSPTVRIVFKVIPPNRATVTWGKKKLGMIKPKAPLIIQRPRDSGPLDVVVRAEGCLPVHSRVYTFTDSTLAVKVTPVDKKNTLYGYREDVPAEPDGGVPGGGADGGAPPPPAGTP